MESTISFPGLVSRFGQRCKAFFQSDWRSKSVEQLSQLFTPRHASGLERKHLGRMFYNKCFKALRFCAKPRLLNVSGKALAAGSLRDSPAANALPLTTECIFESKTIYKTQPSA